MLIIEGRAVCPQLVDKPGFDYYDAHQPPLRDIPSRMRENTASGIPCLAEAAHAENRIVPCEVGEAGSDVVSCTAESTTCLLVPTAVLAAIFVCCVVVRCRLNLAIRDGYKGHNELF